MNLDQKTIAEIKSYTSPPDGVHQVMAATFLLLGSPEKQVRVNINNLVTFLLLGSTEKQVRVNINI